jgi:hypothetical protein
MRRQLLAATAAITTTLALTVTVPAFADHEEPVVEPDNPICEEFEIDDVVLEFLDKIEFPLEGEEDQPTVIDDIEDLFDPADYDLPIVLVIVKGGNSANVYGEPPFHDLVAPDGKEISHIEICGAELDETPTPTPTPTPTETPTDKPTTPAETPAPVPTEVPAGDTEGNSGSAGLFGLVLAASVAVAGAAMAARRRFLHDS